MKLSTAKKLGLGLTLFSGAALAMQQPESTAIVGFNEELSGIADDVFTCELAKPSYRMPKSPSMLVIVAAQAQQRSNSPFTLQDHVRSIGTETGEEKIAALQPSTSVTKNNTEKSLGKSDKDETLSNQSSEHFSAEIEVGKKGSCCHVRTRFKSKTLAKYAATAIGGLIAGLLL